MKCPYCGGAPIRTNGKTIYPDKPELWSRKFILCKPCDAYVGCHVGTDWEPFGTLANKALRKLRIRAHDAFDALWKEGRMTRKVAYGWLSMQMELPFDKTHIGYFNNEQCRRVIELVEEYKREAKI